MAPEPEEQGIFYAFDRSSSDDESVMLEYEILLSGHVRIISLGKVIEGKLEEARS